MWTPATHADLARESLPYATCLSDGERAVLAPLLPAPSRTGRPWHWPLRAVLDAILYVLRTGCTWRHLPHEFPPLGTVHRRFLRLLKAEVCERLAHALTMADRERAGRDASEGFAMLGGRLVERERDRFEILRVPAILKERDCQIGRSDPVLDRYAGVTFEKTLIAGTPQAELVAPGNPLLYALVDVVLERFLPLLGLGSVLVDEADEGVTPRLLVYLEHAVQDGRAARAAKPRVISQRLQFSSSSLRRTDLPATEDRRPTSVAGQRGRTSGPRSTTSRRCPG